ncbi:titin-like [Ostrea edulis]|uniref:titin-like n=1 Tax=Ostrea edulis TaxID=37623 RepID=UPI0024AFF368|nr:titin-like [Ostrea edulis]
MENSDPFEIHNELLSDLITEYLDSAKKEERERNFTKWKLAFRNINDSPYHRACPILWDLYYLEDKKHIGIGKYDKLRSLLTEIGPAGDRINKAEKRIKAVTKDHGESKLDYPVIIEFKSRTKDPFYGDKVTMLAERLTTSDIEWCHVKESESTTRNLDLRLTNYSESTNEERISTLVISEARFEDSGLYYVSSKAGERLSNQLSLKVKGEIPDVFLRESTTCVSLGGTLELEGHVISTPPAKKISFWKLVDGKKGVIDISLEKYTGSTTDIKRTPVLRINKLNFRDEGSYWLRVENAVGRGESKHHEAKFNEDDTTRITRYFRLIHLGGEALKYILERKAKPSLRKYLEENTEEISFLCSRSQMDQLLKGVENLKEMDISVTYTLLRNMPNLDRPSKGWGSTPEDDNILPADDIERIRLHYEYIAQGDIPSLSPTSFTERWTELSKAIQRLNTNVLNPKIEDIKDLKLDKIAIGESLKALESNRKREFDLQFERKNIPIVEIQGLESVKYLKRAELTGNIQSPANISRIVWKKQNIEIDISEKKYSESHCNIGSTEAKLVIQRINIEDIGEYHLLVENESGRARSNILALKIKEKKPKCEILGKAHRTFILGETITLQGKVKSYPQSNVLKWRKEGITKSKKLNLDGEKYKGSNKDHQKPTLVINNIGIKDCGIYILHVENLKGEADSNEIKIDIEGGKLIK